MPRFTAPAPNAESRKALEQRARQASMPASADQKKRWPFSVDSETQSDSLDDEGQKPAANDKRKPS